MFAETRPEAIEAMRAAADELRAELAGDTVTFVVNRNINVSNVCTVGCAFCGFGQGKPLARGLRALRGATSARASREAVAYGATELCIQSGIHPDWSLDDYLHWLRVAKDEGARTATTCTCTPTRRWRSRTCATSPACRRARSSRGCATPGWARRRARPPRSCTTACASASARTSCRSRAGSRSSRPATAPACAHDVDRDVRAHRGAVGARRAHARDPRAAGAHRRHHRVRAALASSRSTRCSAARTGSRRSRARRTSSTPPSSASRSAARSSTCRRAG